MSQKPALSMGIFHTFAVCRSICDRILDMSLSLRDLALSGESRCLGDGDLDNRLRSLVVSLGDSDGGCCSVGTLDLYGDKLRLVT